LKRLILGSGLKKIEKNMMDGWILYF